MAMVGPLEKKPQMEPDQEGHGHGHEKETGYSLDANQNKPFGYTKVVQTNGSETDNCLDSPRTDLSCVPIDIAPKDEHLQELCDQLKLPEAVLGAADSLWTIFQKSDIKELKNDKVGSYVCSVYIASINRRSPYGLSDPQHASLDQPCITVTTLLNITSYSIINFLKLFEILKQNVDLSETVRHHLLGLEKKYLIMCPLFQKFEKIFLEIFQVQENGSTEGDLAESNERKQFTWTLFVYAKSRVADQSQELVFNFHLLLCCLNYVLRMTPGFQLRPPFDTLRVASGENENDLAMLSSLSDMYCASFDDVKLVQAAYLDPMIESLPQVDGSINVEEIKQHYQMYYEREGDINELRFLDNPQYLAMGERESRIKMTSSSSTSCSSGSGNEENTSPQSPAPADQKKTPDLILTPVRAAMTNVQKLHTMLSDIGEDGTTTLKGYFQKCAVNPEGFIQTLLKEMRPIFVRCYKTTMGKNRASIAELRFDVAVKLYYNVMEKLLNREKGRLSEHHFSNLLHNKVSHKCLLACAVEVVLAAYSSNPLTNQTPHSPTTSEDSAGSTVFPWILRVFDLHGFDFFIVLENFSHESRLPPDIAKHLKAVENRLLESAAWKTGSPLFEALSYCDVTSGNTTPQNGDTPLDSVVHPVQVKGPTVTSINSPRSQRSHGLNRFLNKVCALAYKRLQMLCDQLPIPRDIVLKISTCVQYCIVQRSDLLKNRHLDQIMLSCVYAICRVVDNELRFKEILNVYKLLPSASTQTYRSVLLTGDTYDTIIAFYNKIFTQSLKSYILQFAVTKSVNSPRTLSPGARGLVSPSRLQASPSYLLNGRQNFTISPFKGIARSPLAGQITPRTKRLVSLGDGFGSEEKFKDINNWMKTQTNNLPRPPGSKSSKRLAFEQMDSAALCVAGDDEPMMLTKRRKSGASKALTFSAPPTDTCETK